MSQQRLNDYVYYKCSFRTFNGHKHNTLRKHTKEQQQQNIYGITNQISYTTDNCLGILTGHLIIDLPTICILFHLHLKTTEKINILQTHIHITQTHTYYI